MKVFRVNYELNDKSFNAGIVARTKEKALDYLYTVVGTGVRINTIGTGHDVHAIDAEITDQIVENSEKVKRYKKRIKELNNMAESYEAELEMMKDMETKKSQQISSKDIKEMMEQKEQKVVEKIVCPYCDSFSGTSKQGLKQHISKVHKEK